VDILARDGLPEYLVIITFATKQQHTMDAILNAPALPWAAKEDVAEPVEPAEEDHSAELPTDRAVSLDKVGLKEGSRIEVGR
jgi:hypothetical protein